MTPEPLLLYLENRINGIKQYHERELHNACYGGCDCLGHLNELEQLKTKLMEVIGEIEGMMYPEPGGMTDYDNISFKRVLSLLKGELRK